MARKPDHANDLNEQQEIFCREYAQDPTSVHQAAIKAGYSAKSAMAQGSRLLTVAKIKRRVQELLKPKMDRYDISAENILRELSLIAFGRMGDVASWNESGVRFKPSDELTPEAMATVEEVSEHVSENGSSLKIKQHSKAQALNLLGKYQKLFTDKVEHSADETLEAMLSGTWVKK